MEEVGKGCSMIRMGVSGSVFLRVPAYLGSPGPKAVKQLCVCVCVCACACVCGGMCGISGIETFLLQSQFRWVSHIVRMPDFRIPKQAFFGQLARGCRLQGGPVRRYKDSLKINLRACDLAPSVLQTAPLDRSVWRQCCSNAILAFEERQVHSSSCRQAEGQEGPCCYKRDDDVDLRCLRQTMRLAHWSVCPS